MKSTFIAPKKARRKPGPVRLGKGGKLIASEHEEAKAFFAQVEAVRRTNPAYADQLAMVFAVPNGGDRNPIVAAKMRAEGVRKGVSDYLCLVARGGFHGLAIELKAQDGSESAEQREFIRNARVQGYRAEVAYGWRDAWRILCEYLEMPNRVT